MIRLTKDEINFLITKACLSDSINSKLINGEPLNINDEDVIYDRLQDLEQEIGFDINYRQTKHGKIIYQIMKKLIDESEQ